MHWHVSQFKNIKLFIINIVEREYNEKTFSFDKIFTENSSQKEIFQFTSKNIIDNVIEGYNGTIFAYGQTGSGKTYTMVGEYDNYNIRGIIPRSFEYLFNKIESIENEDKSIIFEISIAFIQIYLEKIEDLLEKKII